jgi:hypothetical protein
MMNEIGDENGHPTAVDGDDQYQIKHKKIKRKPGLPQRVDMTGNLVAYFSTTSEGNNILRQSNRKLPSEFCCSQQQQQHPPGSVEARLEKLLQEYPDNERALLLAKKLKARKLSKEKNMNHTPSPRFIEGQLNERERSLGSSSRLHIQALYGSSNNNNETQTTHDKNPLSSSSSSSLSKAQCLSKSITEQQKDRLVNVCVNINSTEETIDKGKDSIEINNEVTATNEKLHGFDLYPSSSIDGRETDNNTTSKIGALLEDIGEKYGNGDSIGPVKREHYSTDDDYETMESKTSIQLTSLEENRGEGEGESPRGTVVKKSKNNSQLKGAKQNNQKKYSTKVREKNTSTTKKNKSSVLRKGSTSSSTTTCSMEETIKCDIIENAPDIVSSNKIMYNTDNKTKNSNMMVQHNVSDDEKITKEKKNNILLGKKQLFGSEADYDTVMSMLLLDTTEDAVSELLVPVGLFVDDEEKGKDGSDDEELGRRDRDHDSDKNTTVTVTTTIRFRRLCILLGITVLVVTAIIGLGFVLGFVSSKWS